MADQVYYRKWRPQRFADVVGQAHISTTLLNALSTGRTAHAYLFCGPRGTGKTSTGRILAKALNCARNGKGEPCNECPNCITATEGRALDLIEIDAASNGGVDDIRKLREKVNFAPNEARFKVYIIDEVHMLSTEAFNALLKTLEEPPPRTVFVLATTEAHKVPGTVISRCQRFDFRRISLSDVAERLSKLCDDEGISAEREVLKAVARTAGGSLRDAQNIMEQLAVGYGQELRIEDLRDFLGMGGEQYASALTAAALERRTSEGLAIISAVADEGIDLRQFHRQLMDYLRALLLEKSGAGAVIELSEGQRAEVQELASSASYQQVLRAVKLFEEVDLRGNTYSTLPLELALVEATSEPDVSAGAPETAQRPQRSDRPDTAARPASPRQATGSRSVGQPVAPTKLPEQPRRIPGAMDQLAARQGPAVEQSIDGRPRPVPSVSPQGGSDSAEIGAKVADGTAAKPEPLTSPERTPAAAQSPVAGGIDPELFSILKANWKGVIEASRGKGQKFKIDALLRSGQPVSVGPEDVVLGFHFQFFIDKMGEEMEHPGTRRDVEEAFGEVLGGRRQVRCVLRAKEKDGGHLVRAAMQMGAKPVAEEGSP